MSKVIKSAVHPFAQVLCVARGSSHSFSKRLEPSIELVKGHGVKGDAHFGTTVKHRSRVAKDPTQPNLRQVHLIANELLQELALHGYTLQAGELGENMLTHGIDLIHLPLNTHLLVGRDTVVSVTGLRNPCAQIHNFRPGLLDHMVEKRTDGTVQFKTGIMGVVLRGGTVRAGDAIRVNMPPKPHIRLERV